MARSNSTAYRKASVAELALIEKRQCPYCQSKNIDRDLLGGPTTIDFCEVCAKHWVTYKNGLIEMEDV